MSNVTEILGQGAAAVAPVATQYGLNYLAAERNQKYYRENMQANYLISQRAQRNAARNEVEGLRSAGLSEALANGAAGAPQVSAQGGTMEAPKVDPANMLLLAQSQLLGAQAKKAEADAKGQEIKNSRDINEDEATGKNLVTLYQGYADSTSDPVLKQFFLDQKAYAESGQANVGNYNALLKFYDIQGKSEEAIARKLDNKLSAWLAELRWNKAKGQTMETSKFVESLASLDVRQSDFLAAECANMIASGKNLDQQIELLKSKKQLTDEQINLTKEQENQIKTAAEAMQDKNMMHWIDKGEYMKAFMVGILQIFSGFATKGRSYAVTE